jgi:16S rRNA (adenine1518-N6/adenine1519-N6)-dimethyltransferase
MKVPPGAFAPAPKVDSAVLSMTRRATPLVPLNDFSKLEKFLRLVFSQKRKQLGGVLKSSYPVSKIDEVFSSLNIEKSIRAEALSLEQVLEMYRKFVV